MLFRNTYKKSIDRRRGVRCSGTSAGLKLGQEMWVLASGHALDAIIITSHDDSVMVMMKRNYFSLLFYSNHSPKVVCICVVLVFVIS